jgi:hypothetical protein
MWLRLALSKGPNRVGVFPHLRMETSSFRNVVFLSSNSLESRQWTKSENPLILCLHIRHLDYELKGIPVVLSDTGLIWNSYVHFWVIIPNPIKPTKEFWDEMCITQISDEHNRDERSNRHNESIRHLCRHSGLKVRPTTIKSNQAISYANVDFVSNILEAVSISIIIGDVMMETETVSKMLDTNSPLTWLSTQNLTLYFHHKSFTSYIDLILLSENSKTTPFTMQSHLPCSN